MNDLTKLSFSLAAFAVAVLGAANDARAQSPEQQPSSPQSAEDEAGPYTVGARIGGYGFRDVAGDGHTRWKDCRMHGIGVFGERGFGDHFYLEGGVDYYFAHDGSVMDRRSGLVTLAGGVRMFPDFVLTPYAQLGLGLEVTRVELQGHDGNTRALPLGFLGFGLDINAGDHVRLGANLRTHMMGHFPHGHDGGGGHGGADDDLPGAEMELSAQVQFYVKYRI